MNRNSILRSALALAGFGALVAPLRADNVTGRVVDARGQGIVGVVIEFDGVAPPGSVTGLNGVFNVIVAPGRYDISFLPPTTAHTPIELLGVQVSGIKDLGVLTLRDGFELSGIVRDGAGNPVVIADINVYDQDTGEKLFTPDDKTDLFGVFKVVVPAGTYRVRARPPSGLLLVAVEIEGVVVAAAKNLGVLTLEPGVLLSGLVVDAVSNAPVPDVDIDVDDAIDGRRIVTPDDNTDANGAFAVIVPTGLFHLSFDPPATIRYLPRQEFNVPINASVNLGALGLSTGWFVAGTVLGPGSAPVVGADVDVLTPTGETEIYVANDDTDATGRYQVVLPPGTYRVLVRPRFATGLVGHRSAPVAVSADTTLPIANLAPGVVLSGVITAYDGKPEPQADIDVVDPATGVELVTRNDDTDANGGYAVIVPTGTFDVRVQTRELSLSRDLTVTGVQIQGATTFSRQLTQVPVLTYFGTVGLPVVPQGGVVPGSFAFFNPTGAVRWTRIRLLLVDPLGGELPLLPPLDVPLAPFQLSIVLGVPFPVPPIAPGLRGLPFRYELRCSDPATGSEQDRDHFKFIVR